MELHEKVTVGAIVVVVIFLILSIYFGATSAGRETWNNWFYKVQKTDDATNYETLKKVEDTCRAMLASYSTDRFTYDQYKTSDSEEKRGWAEQAKMRANKTAATYNIYVLQNTFVWAGNVPDDIKKELQYITN